MTQPVLAKQSFLIALLAGAQAIMPALVAVASLYATIILLGVSAALIGAWALQRAATRGAAQDAAVAAVPPPE